MSTNEMKNIVFLKTVKNNYKEKLSKKFSYLQKFNSSIQNFKEKKRSYSNKTQHENNNLNSRQTKWDLAFRFNNNNSFIKEKIDVKTVHPFHHISSKTFTSDIKKKLTFNQTKFSNLEDKVEVDLNTNIYQNKVDEDKEKENNQFAEFFKSIDFNKYVKDVEVREALNLIKIKVNKDEEIEKINQDQQELEKQNNEEVNEIKEDNMINKEEELINNYFCEKPLVDNIIIENNEVEEKKKLFKKANETLKADQKLKQVHSINSIMRILESQGLSNTEKQVNKLPIIVTTSSAGNKKSSSQMVNIYGTPEY